jgi:hypothetical protein
MIAPFLEREGLASVAKSAHPRTALRSISVIATYQTDLDEKSGKSVS